MFRLISLLDSHTAHSHCDQVHAAKRCGARTRRRQGATSGVLGAPSKLLGGKTDTLLIAPTDTNLTIRVYVDHGLAEGFWQGGRVAMTRIATPAYTGASEGFAVHAVDAVALVRAEAWRVGDIWVSAEEVLRTPRPKKMEDEAPRPWRHRR